MTAATASTATQELARLQAAIDDAHQQFVAAGNRLTTALAAVEAYERDRPREMAAARAAGKAVPKDKRRELEDAARDAKVEHDAAQELVAIRVQEMVDAIEENKEAWLGKAEQRVEEAQSAVAEGISAVEARAHTLAEAHSERSFLREGGVYWNDRMGRWQIRPRSVATLAGPEFAALREALLP